MKRPRSPQQVEKQKNKILAAALSLIVEQGYSALTMRSIAKQTSMTAPNIYNYFSGKDEIYLALVIRGFAMLQKALVAAQKKSDVPLAQARAMALAYLDFGLKNPGYYEIMFTGRTPKYDDYKGTALEPVSAEELRISMEIAALALEVAAGVMGEGGKPDPETSLEYVIQAWSQLHGMVSLSASGVAAYVADDLEKVYGRIIDRNLNMIAGVLGG